MFGGSAFHWTTSNQGPTLMSLSPDGDLSVERDVTAGRNLNVVGDTVRLGGGTAVITVAGSNIGINLDPGVDPTATLHVNGSILSTEQQFMLSDERFKKDVQPLDDALGKLENIRGCMYRMMDDSSTDPLQVGVIAQDVQRAVPQAVRVADDGTLSVSYASLVAVAIDGINELRTRIDQMSNYFSTVCHRRRGPRASSVRVKNGGCGSPK